MNMTITDRDRRVMIYLPGLLLAIGYAIWLSSTGKFGDVSRAQIESTKAEEAAPSKETMYQQQARVAQASRQTEAAAIKVAEARQRFESTVRCADPIRRAERIFKLTTLLSGYGLVVIEHTEAEGGKDRVPASLEAFAKKLPIASPPKLHRITFLSRYPEACELTAALSRDGAVAIPVGLTMKESVADTDWHEWTLLVWV